MKPSEKWLIWSMEHRAFWGPERNGYTRYRASAGRYSFDEAREIITQSECAPETRDFPKEAMIPDKTP